MAQAHRSVEFESCWSVDLIVLTMPRGGGGEVLGDGGMLCQKG